MTSDAKHFQTGITGRLSGVMLPIWKFQILRIYVHKDFDISNISGLQECSSVFRIYSSYVNTCHVINTQTKTIL